MRKRILYSLLFTSTIFIAPLAQADSTLADRIAGWTLPITSLITTMRHGERKKQLLKSIRGDILEVNSHVGENLQYFSTSANTSLQTTARASTVQLLNYGTVEPNPYVRDRWDEAAKRVGLPPVICQYNEPNSKSASTSSSSSDTAVFTPSSASLFSLVPDASQLLSSKSKASSTSRLLKSLSKEESASRDAVIFNFTLSSAPYEEELNAILTNAIRILRPGGRLYFMEMTSQTTATPSHLLPTSSSTQVNPPLSSSPVITSSIQKILSPFYRFFNANTTLSRPIAAILMDRPEFTSIYMEQWPNSSPDVEHNQKLGTKTIINARHGITQVTRNKISNDQNDASPKYSWKGLHGIHSVVAGVAVKDRTILLNESEIMDDLLKFGSFKRSGLPPQI
jgi:hypothetical protein